MQDQKPASGAACGILKRRVLQQVARMFTQSNQSTAGGALKLNIDDPSIVDVQPESDAVSFVIDARLAGDTMKRIHATLERSLEIVMDGLHGNRLNFILAARLL